MPRRTTTITRDILIATIPALITLVGTIITATLSHNQEIKKIEDNQQQLFISKSSVDSNFIPKVTLDSKYISKDSVTKYFPNMGNKQQTFKQKDIVFGSPLYPNHFTYDFNDYISHTGFSSEIVLSPNRIQHFPIHLEINLQLSPKDNPENSTYWWACITEMNGTLISNSKQEVGAGKPPCSYQYTTLINQLPEDRKIRIRFNSAMSVVSRGDRDMVILAGSTIVLK